jgi:hypothetical protein
MSADRRSLGERVFDVLAGRWTAPDYDAALVEELIALLREQQAEIAKINRYLSDAELRESALEEEAARNVAERDSLRRGLEVARVDAERYRWLRNNCKPRRAKELVEHRSGVAMDAAIDAARARGEGNADE